MECEDCGRFLVVEQEFISIFEIDDEFTAITRCAYCDRPVFQEVNSKTIDKFLERKVKVFSWATGSEYEFKG